MKLKLIVAALGLIASASSFADILVPSTVGGGELYFVVYEQGAPNGGLDQSFTLDLGINVNSFMASQNTFQNWATLTAATNSVWANFLATSNIPSLQFAVMGAKSTSTSTSSSVASSVFSTVTLGGEANVVGATAAAQNSNSQLSSMIGGTMTAYSNNVSNTGSHLTQANGESVNAIGSGAYFQDANMAAFNTTLKFTNSDAVGSAPVEFTSLYRSPVGSGKAAQAVMPGTVLFAQSGNDYVLTYGANLVPTVTPVPEASTYALLLSGLGALGFVARRRKQS